VTEKVTFYIPTFNAQNTIELCINSVRNQTYPVDEIIIINDNSTDNTKEILSKYNDLIIINNNQNLGLGYNRNLGIKNSSNEIIASIDSDVELDKKWLENIIINLKKNKIVMCGGNMLEKYTNNKVNAWREKYYNQSWGKKDILNPAFLYGCNTILLKSYWEKTEGYDENLKTNGEDIDFCKQLKSIGDINLYYSSDSLCYHLQDDSILSLSKRVWRYHSFGYKIKAPSKRKLVNLSIKQIRFFLIRFLKGLLKFEIKYIIISFMVLINFIKLEYNYLKKNK
tara:strand:- start:4938 stop:5783 length:846 start_codon:yes stop_codon:yes gene_type:complete